MPETPAERLARLRARVQQGGGGEPDSSATPPASDARARLTALRRGIDERAATATNPVSDAAAQVLAAPAKMVTTFGEGALRLADMGARAVGLGPDPTLTSVITGERPKSFLERGADALRERRETINEVVAPETRTGRVAQVTSDLAANVLPYVASGGALGLARGAAASAGLTGVQAAAGRDASTIGMIADVTDDEGATGVIERIASNPTARVAADVAIDAGISAASAFVPGGYRAAKQKIADLFAARAARNAPPAPPRALPPGQYEMPGVPEPITDPARLLPAEAQSVPRPRQAYEGPAGPAIPMQSPEAIEAAERAARAAAMGVDEAGLAASAATPEDIAAYRGARGEGRVLQDPRAEARLAQRAAIEERAAIQADAPSASDFYGMPLEDLRRVAPPSLPPHIRALNDTQLMAATALRQRQLMDDFAAAQLLDDPRIVQGMNESSGNGMAYAMATQQQRAGMRRADREQMTGLLGAPEEARLAQRLGLSEEGLARLEETGRSLYDLEAAVAASKRLEAAQRTVARLEAEVERRGLAAAGDAADDVSFDFGANVADDVPPSVPRETPAPAAAADDVAEDVDDAARDLDWYDNLPDEVRELDSAIVRTANSHRSPTMPWKYMTPEQQARSGEYLGREAWAALEETADRDVNQVSRFLDDVADFVRVDGASLEEAYQRAAADYSDDVVQKARAAVAQTQADDARARSDIGGDDSPPPKGGGRRNRRGAAAREVVQTLGGAAIGGAAGGAATGKPEGVAIGATLGAGAGAGAAGMLRAGARSAKQAYRGFSSTDLDFIQRMRGSGAADDEIAAELGMGVDTFRRVEQGTAQAASRGARASDLPPEVRGQTAFDIGGVAGAALKTRPGQSAALGTVGAALTEAEDERIQNTGRGLIGLAALHAGAPFIRRGGRAAGRAAKEGLQQSALGRKVLDALSYDIQASPEVKAVVEAFEQETARGRARSLELANKARGLGSAADRRVSDIVEREAFERTTLDPETAKRAAAVAQEISDEFTRLGREKVRTGVLSAATVAKREGQYLPRVYGQQLAEDVADDVVLNQGTRKIRIKGDRIRNDELRPETRNMLGEVRESSYRTQMGLERGYRDVAAARLFGALREMPGVVNPEYGAAFDAAAQARAALDVAKASGDEAARKAAQLDLVAANGRLKALGERFENAREGFVRLPDTKAMGALRGAVVRKDVADYLNMVPNLAAPQGIFRNILSFWKRAHTVWNPGTHVGNTISNAVMAHMGGLPLPEQVVALPAAIKDVRGYGPITRYLAERGVLERGLPTFGDGPVRGLSDDRTTLRALATTTRKETRDALARGGINPMGRGERVVRGAMSKAEQMYGLEDAVYRVALFKKLTKNGMPREQAADFVSKQFVDYQTRSPVLGALKNTVSPFILYPAKAIPRVLEQIVEHPWRWAALAAVWGGLDQASRRRFGDVQERDLRPGQRQGRNTGYLLPGAVQVDAITRPILDHLGTPTREGDNYVFDVARWTPLSALTGAAAPGSLGSAAFGDEFPGILQPSGPWVDLGARLTNTEPFTGEKWLTDADDPAAKAMKVLGGAASFAGPSALSFHLPRVVRDLQNDDSDAALVDAAGFLGLRPQVVRQGLQPAREQWDVERTIRDIRQQLRQDLRKAKSEERRAELTARAKRRMQQVIDQHQSSRLP